MHLGLDEGRRHRDLDLLDELVDDLVARLRTLAEHLGAGDLLLDVVLELLDGVELARDLCEVVVGLGQLALLDRLDRDRDEGGLALVVAAEQHRVERRGLACREGVERVVDAVDELTGAQLVRDRVRGVDDVVADLRLEVDLQEVALLRRAVDGDECAEARAQGIQLVLDVVGADLGVVDLELEAVVLRQVELGTHVDLDRQHEVAGEVLLVRPLGDVRLGATDRAHLLVAHRLAVELVEAVAHRVVEHLGTTDALVDELRRHLALAESGDVDLRTDVLVRVVDRGLELLWRH